MADADIYGVQRRFQYSPTTTIFFHVCFPPTPGRVNLSISGFSFSNLFLSSRSQHPDTTLIALIVLS